MKKFLGIFLAFIFILTPIGAIANETEAPVLIAESLEAPALPSTYVKDDFQLMAPSQTLEEFLLSAWANMDTYVKVIDFRMPVQKFINLYWQLLHDNPEYFWVGGEIKNAHSSGGNMYDFTITYAYTDPDVIAEKKAALDSATADILLQIDDEMTDFEKVMTVHDYMVLNYSYGTSDVMHTIFIMTEKTGVCMGYALAFNHLMNVLGIDCTYVASNEMNHAWNLVKLDGQWYHIDLTYDDPTRNYQNMFAYIRHEYALLSSDGIANAEESHYGFDLGDVRADSTLYDNATWRHDAGAMAYCNSKLYFVAQNNIVNEDGNVIHAKLDGGDGKWNLTTSSYLGGSYCGLTSYGKTLYYNTDKAIYSYNTETKKETKILSKTGICGLYADKNILKYSKYNKSAQTIDIDSEIVLEKEEGSAIIGSSIHAGEKIITPIYKEDSEPMFVFCHSGTSNKIHKLQGEGSFTVESSAGDIFFWTDKFKPLAPKHTVN